MNFDLGSPIDILTDAMLFSDGDEEQHQEYLGAALLKEQWLHQPLKEYADSFAGPLGAPRQEGDWALLGVFWTLYDRPVIYPWLKKTIGRSVLDMCGFPPGYTPSHDTVERRFEEFERNPQIWIDLTNRLIRLARKAVPAIGTVVHTDATAFRTSSRLHHCCEDRDKCRAAGRGRAIQPLSHDVMWALEQKEKGRTDDEEAEEHEDALNADRSPAEIAEARKKRDEAKAFAAELTPVPITRKRIVTDQNGKQWAEYEFTGHTYRMRDTSAGIRTYQRPNGKTFSWTGGTAMRSVDGVTGGPLATWSVPADVNEPDALPILRNLLNEALGKAGPGERVMTLDRAYGYPRIHRENYEDSFETVCPKRIFGNGKTIADHRTDQVDEDGVIRCRYCGGPTTQEAPNLGPYNDSRNGKGRIRFRCALGLSRKCKRTKQSISRDENWLLITAIPRTAYLYHSLRVAHQQREHTHQDQRDRNAVFAKEYGNMQRRAGIEFANLRGLIGAFLDWFRFCLRLGLLGAIKNVLAIQYHPRIAAKRLAKAIGWRRKKGLNLPYGPTAEKLGYALPEKPPDQPQAQVISAGAPTTNQGPKS